MSIVEPGASIVSRTSFSDPSTPAACKSITTEPLEYSFTLSAKYLSVIPTIVSSGLTSAITSVTVPPEGLLDAPWLPAPALSVLAPPHPTHETTIATQHKSDKSFFLIRMSLL